MMRTSETIMEEAEGEDEYYNGGYYDANGMWVEVSGYYDENGEWVETGAYYDENGDYIHYAGFYDENGEWIEVEPPASYYQQGYIDPGGGGEGDHNGEYEAYVIHEDDNGLLENHVDSSETPDNDLPESDSFKEESNCESSDNNLENSDLNVELIEAQMKKELANDIEDPDVQERLATILAKRAKSMKGAPGRKRWQSLAKTLKNRMDSSLDMEDESVRRSGFESCLL